MPRNGREVAHGLQAGWQFGNNLVAALNEAMARRRDDAIADDLMKTIYAPRAQAVNPALQAPADARAATMPVPLGSGGGTRGLALRLQLEKAMQDRGYQAIRQAEALSRIDLNRARGVAATAKGPEYWAAVAEDLNNKPAIEAYKGKIAGWKEELKKHAATVASMQNEIAMQEASLTGRMQAATGRADVSALEGAPIRAKEGGFLGFGAEERVKIATPDGELSMSPQDYSDLAAAYAQLKARRKALGELRAPQMPVFESGRRDDGAPPDETAAARAWAKANPKDPRAAKILRALGVSAEEEEE